MQNRWESISLMANLWKSILIPLFTVGVFPAFRLFNQFRIFDGVIFFLNNNKLWHHRAFGRFCVEETWMNDFFPYMKWPQKIKNFFCLNVKKFCCWLLLRIWSITCNLHFGGGIIQDICCEETFWNVQKILRSLFQSRLRKLKVVVYLNWGIMKGFRIHDLVKTCFGEI